MECKLNVGRQIMTGKNGNSVHNQGNIKYGDTDQQWFGSGIFS